MAFSKQYTMVKIKVVLAGGVGNQMFYYSAARAISNLFCDSEILLELSYFTDSRGNPNVTPRSFSLHNFCLPSNVRIFNQNEPFDIEVKHPTLDASGICSLRETLVQDFRPKPHILKLLPESLVSCIQNTGSRSVAVHVRRGDYITNPAAASHHTLLSPTYYQDAIDIISLKIRNPQYFVFSDDIAFCKQQNLIKSDNVYYVNLKSAYEDILELYLMQKCYNFIIANSSFSFWPAFLSQSNMVICPKYWFKNKDIKNLLRIYNWIDVPNN